MATVATQETREASKVVEMSTWGGMALTSDCLLTVNDHKSWS